MASPENGDGSENLPVVVGSPSGLLPVAMCLPYYPYPPSATATSFAPGGKGGCTKMDVEVILRSMEIAVLGLTLTIPTELL